MNALFHPSPSRRFRLHGTVGTVLVVTVSALTACSSPTRVPAPVEDRSTGARPPAAVPAPVASPQPVAPKPGEGVALPPPTATPPGAENAGKPGYYTVRPGDTLIRIGLEHGQNWRDLVRWNSLENPNLIEVGQVLRVVPPTEAAVARPVAAGAVTAAGSPAAPRPGTATAAAPAPVPVPTPPAPAPASAGEDDLAWVWPVNGGPIVAPFDEAKNKGIGIAGNAGDPVLASADGRVVYAGAGLRGYGNLIILKHNNTFLSAYAHNQTLLVKEDQTVRRGQKIAEMGSTDADRVKLHFEIRRQGKPVDPVKYLPPR